MNITIFMLSIDKRHKNECTKFQKDQMISMRFTGMRLDVGR